MILVSILDNPSSRAVHRRERRTERALISKLCVTMTRAGTRELRSIELTLTTDLYWTNAHLRLSTGSIEAGAAELCRDADIVDLQPGGCQYTTVQ